MDSVQIGKARVLAIVTAAALACFAALALAAPAKAHAATYSAAVYNGTVVGSDWGEDGHVKTARLSGKTLRLGTGFISNASNFDSVNCPKAFKLAKSCKFYRANSSYKFSKKISRSAFKKTLKKANRKLGRGRYNPHYYELLFKTKKGKVTKLGIMKNPSWSTGY